MPKLFKAIQKSRYWQVSHSASFHNNVCNSELICIRCQQRLTLNRLFFILALVQSFSGCNLQKHQFFWTGFFVAVFTIVPIAIGVWGVAENRALDLAAVAFGAASVLVLLLVIVLFFRDRILSSLLGQTEGSLETIAHSTINAVEDASTGNREKAIGHATEAVKSAVSWYAWTGFYRWVIGTCAAILLAFGTFTGSVLLFEQNKKISEQTAQFSKQNALLALSMVSELRNRLGGSSTIPDRSAGLSNIRGAGRECWLEGREQPLKEVGTTSEIFAIVDLIRSPEIGNNVIASLIPLLKDDNPIIALSALIALSEKDAIPDGTEVNISDVYIGRLELTGNFKLNFRNSIVGWFECEDCLISLSGSYLMGRPARVNFLTASELWLGTGFDFEPILDGFRWPPVGNVAFVEIDGSEPVTPYTETDQPLAESTVSLVAGQISRENEIALEPVFVPVDKSGFQPISEGYLELVSFAGEVDYCNSLKRFANYNKFFDYRPAAIKQE